MYFTMLFTMGCNRQETVDMAIIRPLEGTWAITRMRLYPTHDFNDDSTWVPSVNRQVTVAFDACRRRDERERICQGHSDFDGHRHLFNYHKLVISPMVSALSDRWGLNGEYVITSHTESRLILTSSDYNRFTVGGTEYSAVIELERR